MNNNRESSGMSLMDDSSGYDIGNYDPADLQTDEVILVCIAMDVSPSVSPFENELNDSFKAFLEEMQKSHVAPKLMVKTLEFNETVIEKTGFQPIGTMDLNDFTFRARGSSTALADAAMKALKETSDYRLQLESTGINCKSLVFVITDGQENASRVTTADVKTYLDGLMKDEKNVFSVETILFGIGGSNSFAVAQAEMGFKHLAVVGNTGKEVRKMIGFISQSISRSSANQGITF